MLVVHYLWQSELCLLDSCLLLLLTPKCGYSLKAFSLIFFCLCLPPWQSLPDPWVIQRIHSSFSLSLQHFNLITDQYFFYFLDISAWLSGRTSNSTHKANSFSCQQNCSSFALSWRLYSLPSSLPLLSLQCYRTSEMSHTFMLCVPVLCYRILHTTFASVSHSPGPLLITHLRTGALSSLFLCSQHLALSLSHS